MQCTIPICCQCQGSGGFRTHPTINLGRKGYIEGNAWNYSLYIPHDIKGFLNLLGGKQKLVNWLDSLFTMQVSEESYAHSEDISKVGIIGNYVHANEPSHQVPYMYCFSGTPWKTQERIHQIVNSMYKNKPDGLSGNDDCGQMSAWYIFSVLGFYPVAPGSNEYVIGSPCINSASINLENGKHFKIEVEGNLTEEHPKFYDKVKVTYLFFSKDFQKDKIEKAVNLSAERYCGVMHMFRQFAEVSIDIRYIVQ